MLQDPIDNSASALKAYPDKMLALFFIIIIIIIIIICTFAESFCT